MFLSQIFVTNAKNDRRTLFERPKSGKNENRKNAEVVVSSEKVAFLGIQIGKTQPFSRYQLQILHTYSVRSVLALMFRFFENSKISWEI